MSKPASAFADRTGCRSGRAGFCASCAEAVPSSASPTKKDDVWWMCESKRSYPTFDVAVSAALDANLRRGTPLRVYPCPHGDHHHLTKRTNW